MTSSFILTLYLGFVGSPFLRSLLILQASVILEKHVMLAKYHANSFHKANEMEILVVEE